MPTNLPPGFTTSRADLHRVAAHVLARRRSAATGRFGLRPTPGGFGTPAFADGGGEEVLRVAGGVLVRERRDEGGTSTRVHPLGGASLAALAGFAGADLSAPLSVGRDTPDPGDVEAPLAIAIEVVDHLGGWFAAGAVALDRVISAAGPGAAPSMAQLWPEHFDLAVDLAAGASRANLGVSAGDGFHAGPYAYVGPWTPERPGGAAFWNAPFGALVDRESLDGGADLASTIAGFFRRGLDLLAG